MSKPNDEARVLCPRTCIDCCCQEHHWGDYSGASDEGGLEDNAMACKHCPAILPYTTPCLNCGKELIDHDLDTLACDQEMTEDSDPKFRYAGQPVRQCKQVHPWDKEEREAREEDARDDRPGRGRS